MKTVLATGPITPDATLNIELVDTPHMPQVVLIVWPVKPTHVRPQAYAETASRIMRVLARASTELARKRASEL